MYEGGFFKCHLIFPKEYPLMPPKLKVITDIWHPNIEKMATFVSQFYTRQETT